MNTVGLVEICLVICLGGGTGFCSSHTNTGEQVLETAYFTSKPILLSKNIDKKSQK